MNEFEDSDDKIGFLSSEKEAFSFLSADTSPQTERITGFNYTHFDWTIQLGKNKKLIQRQVYTFMTLIGDFGGFNGAVIMFPAFFLSFYS